MNWRACLRRTRTPPLRNITWTGAISIKAAREWKRPAPPAPPAEDTATPTRAERPQKEREPVVERDKVPDTQAAPPERPEAEETHAAEDKTPEREPDTGSNEPPAAEAQKQPDTAEETRCIDSGICPHCREKFDAAEAVNYSTLGTQVSGPVNCPHCGELIKIFCSVEYLCSPAEE